MDPPLLQPANTLSPQLCFPTVSSTRLATLFITIMLIVINIR